MDMTATTYSYATVSPMSGETIKTMLEDVCDNLFNPDPYYQQGGDMVRVGGLEYSCNPLAPHGQAHRRHAPERQADRGGAPVQGGGLGARWPRRPARPATSRCGNWWSNG